MIITDIRQLQEIPVGESVTLVLQFRVVKTDLNDVHPCGSCVFDNSFCCNCCSVDRPDKKEVKFIKV